MRMEVTFGLKNAYILFALENSFGSAGTSCMYIHVCVFLKKMGDHLLLKLFFFTSFRKICKTFNDEIVSVLMIFLICFSSSHG